MSPPCNRVLNLLLRQLPDEAEVTCALIDLLLETHPTLTPPPSPPAESAPVLGYVGPHGCQGCRRP